MSITQLIDRLENEILSDGKHFVISNRQRSDHADGAALAHDALRPPILHSLPTIYQHASSGGKGLIICTIKRHLWNPLVNSIRSQCRPLDPSWTIDLTYTDRLKFISRL